MEECDCVRFKQNSKNGLTVEYHTLYLNMQSYAGIYKDIQEIYEGMQKSGCAEI